ncbi:MAG TPA: hypothetical protein VFJ43_13795 [Bacteroidia bacterium]|nr:hypothetical protein [Bacteroidia bacterium]
MATMEKSTTEKRIGDNLISTLKKSINELEEFQVQIALGKAEAKDKFEEVKKKLNSFLHTTKQKINAGKIKAAGIRGDFEELQVQLALGKAESIEAFNEQKKKISYAISKLEKSLENKTLFLSAELDEKLRHEFEKFKIKMEVLRVQFELGKLDAKDAFEEKKHEFAEGLAFLKAKFEARKKASAKTRQLRHAEMKEAYKHVKKAFIQA